MKAIATVLKAMASIVVVAALTWVTLSPVMADPAEQHDHVSIERTTAASTVVRVVKGTDPETGRHFIEETTVDPETGRRTVTRTERHETTMTTQVDPEVRTEYVEVPVEPAPAKARLAVLPAVFSRHFKPEIRTCEQVDITGRINLRMVFTTEHEARMTAPSFTLSLTEAFVGSRKFDVMERARLAETLQEVDFGESQYADMSKVVPMGRALNAEYVVLPQVEVIQLIEHAREVPYVGTIQPELLGKMVVRTRVVDTATTQVVSVSTEEVQVQRRPRPGDPFSETELHGLVMDLYRTASLRLLHRTLESIYPVRLVEVDAGEVVLNRGEGAIDVGDTFDVYSLGRAYVDPDTGVALGRRESRVAAIRVVRVAPKLAYAKILEGQEALTGDLSRFLCRESAESIRQKTEVGRRPVHW